MSRSLSQLQAIFLDDELPMRRRIEAAGIALQYQSAPGEAERSTVAAYEFLQAVGGNDDIQSALRLEALEIAAKYEQHRPRDTNSGAGVIYGLRRRLENARRRVALIQAGQWPPPPGYAIGPDEIADDVTVFDATGIADRLAAARRRRTQAEPRLLTDQRLAPFSVE